MEPKEFDERVICINRCAKVVKGGKRFSFNALVVVGDRKGRVGYGFGKANEVPPSVQKAVKDAKKRLRRISLLGETIPYEVMGKFGATKVFLRPASPGTGVIAGASVRAVVELAGVKNILTKVFGSTNPGTVVRATMEGLGRLRTQEQVAILRGKAVTSNEPQTN